MRIRLVLVTAVAALFAATAALAGNGHGNARFSFLGQLTATPSNGGVSITVQGGNKLALRAMLGSPVTQTFAYNASTEFLKWSKGIPAVVQPGDLAAGDFVWVHVRAPRDASLAQLEQQPAGLVGDHGTALFKPTQPLYLFRGKLTAVIGSSSDQSLAFGDGTIFLLWQGKVPTVIDASKLVVGDRIVVRIRAPKDATLAQVEATTANHIGDREPAKTP